METRTINNKEILEYLKSKSSEMKALIDLTGSIQTYRIKDPFTCLVSQIIYQSISIKAAATIWERMYHNIQPFTPEKLLEYTFDEIKDFGLSKPKTQYILNIVNAFLYNEINTNFEIMSDEEVKKELTSIKGIGEWTAEMFLIFCLERPNVISYKDYGIRKGIEWLYDLQHPLTKEEFNYYKDLFSPYNTTASHYLWEVHLRSTQLK